MPDEAAGEINLQFAGAEDGAVPLFGEAVAQGGADAGEQFADAEGFFHVVVRTAIKGGDLFRLAVARR